MAFSFSHGWQSPVRVGAQRIDAESKNSSGKSPQSVLLVFNNDLRLTIGRSLSVIAVHMGMANSSAQSLKFNSCVSTDTSPRSKGNMTQTPISVAERRLAIARRLYEAAVSEDPDRAITLHDSSGKVVTHHDPRSEQSSSDTSCGKDHPRSYPQV